MRFCLTEAGVEGDMGNVKPLDQCGPSGVQSPTIGNVCDNKACNKDRASAAHPSISNELSPEQRGNMERDAAKSRQRPWEKLTSADVKTWGQEDPSLRPLFRRLVRDALDRDTLAVLHLKRVLTPMLKANAANIYRRSAGWYAPGELADEYLALLLAGLPLGVLARRNLKRTHNDPPPVPALQHWLDKSDRSFSDFVWIVIARRTRSLNARFGRRAEFEVDDPGDAVRTYSDPDGGRHYWSPEDTASWSEAALQIAGLLEEMGERNRKMLCEYFESPDPAQEIAYRYGIDPSTLSNLVKAFRSKVSAVLGDPAPDSK